MPTIKLSWQRMWKRGIYGKDVDFPLWPQVVINSVGVGLNIFRYFLWINWRVVEGAQGRTVYFKRREFRKEKP